MFSSCAPSFPKFCVSFSLFFFTFFNAYVAFAALSCSVTTAAGCSNTVVLRLSGATNAHSELPSESNANYANNVICCSGVSGLGNVCSGTFATVLKLSGITNAHVEQNTESNYGQSACLSAPGSATIAYQASNCTGYDTTLGSISAVTNAHIGDSTAYTTKVCGTASAGTLSADIVDSGGASVSSPAVSLDNASLGFGCQTTTGTLGTSSEKIRVTNSTSNAPWSLSIAATASTALWDQGANHFDFNDSGGSGCTDGGDADSYGGQMTANPSSGTITPQSGCSATGVSLGSGASFVEGSTNSITLASANGAASTGCYWDITGISVSQKIPVEQAPVTYALNLTVSVVAN